MRHCNHRNSSPEHLGRRPFVTKETPSDWRLWCSSAARLSCSLWWLSFLVVSHVSSHADLVMLLLVLLCTLSSILLLLCLPSFLSGCQESPLFMDRLSIVCLLHEVLSPNILPLLSSKLLSTLISFAPSIWANYNFPEVHWPERQQDCLTVLIAFDWIVVSLIFDRTGMFIRIEDPDARRAFSGHRWRVCRTDLLIRHGRR